MLTEVAFVVASWYGEPFLGRKTASGEVFVSYRMTAAVYGFPIGGKPYRVRVRHNSRRLIVWVNDRCSIPGRLDLSPAAAKYLGIEGTGKVSVTRIP